jgi:glutamyl-tRNA reductase
MNHKTAPVEIRERLQIACGGDGPALAELLGIPDVREVLLLSTCNRVEVLARVADGEAAVERLKEFICRQGNLDAAELKRCLYVHRDREAVRHLFRVAASLDSLIMGEPQILGQVKEAYRRAVDHRATGVLLNRLVHTPSGRPSGSGRKRGSPATPSPSVTRPWNWQRRSSAASVGRRSC